MRSVLFLNSILICLSANASSKDMNSEYINVNGVPQWIYYMIGEYDKPVILFLHGGPGTPETPFIQAYNQNLTQHFTVVCWEQRGAGRSFMKKKIPPKSMTMSQFIEDAHVVTQFIKNKFKKDKIILMGHSWGTLLGIKTIKKYPDDYSHYVALAQTSDAYTEELLIYDWLIDESQKRKNKKAIRQLQNVEKPQRGKKVSYKDLKTKLKWVNEFGGAAFYGEKNSFWKLVKCVLKAPMYTFKDKIKYLKSEKWTLQFLYDQIASVNLFEEIKALEVPIVFFHGTGDYQVPIAVAKSYFIKLEAKNKKFIEMNGCAHGLLIEKPEKFLSLLLNAL